MNKKTFVAIAVLCLIGSFASEPYRNAFYENATKSMDPYGYQALGPWLALAYVLVALWYAFVCWVSYRIIRKTDLNPFPATPLLQYQILPAVGATTVLYTGFLASEYILNRTLGIDLTRVYYLLKMPTWKSTLNILSSVIDATFYWLLVFPIFYLVFTRLLKVNRSSSLGAVTIFTAIFALLVFVVSLQLFPNVITPPLDCRELTLIIIEYFLLNVLYGWFFVHRGYWATVSAIATFLAATVITIHFWVPKSLVEQAQELVNQMMV